MVWKVCILFGISGCSAIRNMVPTADIERDSSAEIEEPGTVHWNLCSGVGGGPAEHSSNLGGGGPHHGSPHEFRINNIAEWDGVNLDLVVAVANNSTYSSWTQRLKKGGLGAYVSPSPNLVGQAREEPEGPPCWAIIPIEVNTHTRFTFKFVKSGGHHPHEVVVVENFSMKIVEFDNERNNWDGKGPDREYIVFNTPVASLSSGDKVFQSVTNDDLIRIESTEAGKWNDNPSITGPRGGCSPVSGDPYGCLHKYQEDRSARVSYTNIGQWDLTFGHSVPSGTRGDRVIEFYGSMHPPAGCKWVPWKFCNDAGDATEFHSNLANKGPHNGILANGQQQKPEFRIKNIAEVEGIMLDLVLTVAADSEYKSYSQSEKANAHGAYVSPSPKIDKPKPEQRGPPCWGVLPIQVKTTTKFDWKLVPSMSDTPKVVKHFKLTVVELDNEGSVWTGKDREELGLHTVPYKVTPREGVLDTWRGDPPVRTITSKENGDAKDNPTQNDACNHDNPYSCLTDEQNKRRVDIEYKGIGAWQMSFGHTIPPGGGTSGDRVLNFYGSTCESRSR